MLKCCLCFFIEEKKEKAKSFSVCLLSVFVVVCLFYLFGFAGDALGVQRRGCSNSLFVTINHITSLCLAACPFH